MGGGKTGTGGGFRGTQAFRDVGALEPGQRLRVYQLLPGCHHQDMGPEERKEQQDTQGAFQGGQLRSLLRQSHNLGRGRQAGDRLGLRNQIGTEEDDEARRQRRGCGSSAEVPLLRICRPRWSCQLLFQSHPRLCIRAE